MRQRIHPKMLARLLLIPAIAPGIANAEVITATAPGLSLHTMPASFALGCAALDTETSTCADLDTTGAPSTMQFVFVVASHIDTLCAVQFGVSYSDSANMLAWNSCGSSLDIGDSVWPASGGGIAIAFPDPRIGAGSDSLSVIGYWLVDVDAAGLLELTVDSSFGAAAFVDSDAMTIDFEASWLGKASLDGGPGGCRPCGRYTTTVVYDGTTVGGSEPPPLGEPNTRRVSWSELKGAYDD